MKKDWRTWALALLPVAIVLWIWFSALSFVPVPWPDDSAFYFVGREFWKWPPRWVMLPQAPFEPTYRIYNFNTMPLFPMLIGLGRLIGIDGSFAIKIWPLSFYAASGSLLAVWLFRAGMPAVLAALLGAGLVLNPGARWAAVLVRPESLIALCGMAIVLGLSLGFPKRLQPRGLWDPIAALLAIGAYAHFNAVHLVFPVVVALLWQPRRILQIGLNTALYLTPWVITVALKPTLFYHQMRVQWARLAHPNSWLNSVSQAITGIFQDMGSPEPWPSFLRWGGGIATWALIIGALGALGALIFRRAHSKAETAENTAPQWNAASVDLLPSAAWVLSSCWLWYTKPEAWFNYYIHISAWTFGSLALLAAWKNRSTIFAPWRNLSLAALAIVMLPLLGMFAQVDIAQAHRLNASHSWQWQTYRDFVQCIDEHLSETEKKLGYPKPFRAWFPTFPDVTIEISRRHPDWELTRTNDFMDRVPLALQHGRDVEAVVVTETLGWSERYISDPASQHPKIKSVWMTWKPYFLNTLYTEPGWKPNRWICQRGRWQAFIFEN